MKTKEEILDKNFNYGFTGMESNAIYKAMEEYAKQQSINFAKWLHFNYQPHADEGCWYNHHDDQSGETSIRTEELYQLFLKSQNT